MSVIEKLNATDLKLSKSDRRLLDYIRENGLNACSAPISEIARSCDVSHATVTRFARKFGYSSLRSFKIDLARELGSEENQGSIISDTIAYDEPCSETAKKLLQINLATLRQTVNDIDPKGVELIADKILKAKRVFFIGIGNSGFAASDSAYKFLRTGIDARSCTDSHAMIIEASLVKNGDLVIAFSNSGETREILKACETAKINHAGVIAITADANSSLHKLSEMSLVYAVRESYMETGSINSKIAVFFIVDLLFTEVVKRLGNDAYSTKQKTALALKKTEGADFPKFSHKF